MVKVKNVALAERGFAGWGPVTFGHMDYGELVRSGIVPRRFNVSAYKFAFVRHPVSRFASLYAYLYTRRKTSLDLDAFLDQVADGVEPIGLYNVRGLSQCNPQTAWLYDRNGDCVVHDVYRLEDFEAAVRTISQTVGVAPLHLAANATALSREVEEAVSTPSRLARIRVIYACDFERLGYDPDSVTADTARRQT